jgi:hypothetical protein
MSRVIRALLPPIILALGIALMVFGIWRGELNELFQKAVIVCLECIGIG